MSTKPVPEPWAKRMRQRGMTQGDGQPNLSALARHEVEAFAERDRPGGRPARTK